VTLKVVESVIRSFESFSVDLGVLWSTKDSLDTNQSVIVFWTTGLRILKIHP